MGVSAEGLYGPGIRCTFILLSTSVRLKMGQDMRLVVGICLVSRLTPVVVGVLPAGGWWGLLDVFYFVLWHKGFFCHLILCIIEILDF